MAHEIKVAGAGCALMTLWMAFVVALQVGLWGGVIYFAFWAFKHFFGA